jgi:ABC-type branched-subunit amino acid transport system substrate-binding protein
MRLRILLALLLCAGIVRAQDRFEYSETAEQTFARAVELMRAGDVTNAATEFNRVLASPQTNQRTTAAYVMRAKCLLQLGDPVEAGRMARQLLSRFPASSYVPDAEYTLGLVYVKIERYSDAVQFLLQAWRSRADVSRRAFDALDLTISSHVDLPATRTLLESATTAEERAFFWLKIGEKEAEAGRSAAVGVVLDTLYQHYPAVEFRDRIARLRVHLETRNKVKVGVLLPLLRKSDPSAVKELGNEILEGVQIALEEYTANPEMRVAVSLEVRDTERDQLVATRGAQELTSDEDIVAIIGPVFSNEVTAVAPLANRRGYPLISPTANANGIAALGQYVFQANPDYEMRGRAMARYAVLRKGYHNLAVLAPRNTFGKFMAESFAAEALKLGARLVTLEWYEKGAADLAEQMSSIRKEGLRAGLDPMISFGGRMSRSDVAHLAQLGVPMRRLDSLMSRGARISATALLGPHARHIVDSLGIAVAFDEPGADSLEIPVTSIEGIYVPISSSDEIGVISSQMVYYNIQAQMLGSGEWNNLKELDANKRYCSNVIFESDSYVDNADPAFGKFSDQYMARFKKKPGKNALYGYDVASMVLTTIHTSGTSRDALAAGLRTPHPYRGLHASTQFSAGRVNSWLWIMQFTDDQISKVDGFAVE